MNCAYEIKCSFMTAIVLSPLKMSFDFEYISFELDRILSIILLNHVSVSMHPSTQRMQLPSYFYLNIFAVTKGLSPSLPNKVHNHHQYKYTGDYTKSCALIGSLSRIISR